MANNGFEERLTKKRRLWQAHVHAWRKSGLSQVDYCQRHKLSSSQFCYWKKKANQKKSRNSVSFVPVPVSVPDSELPVTVDDDSGLTIHLENGISISLTNNFAANTMTRVVDLLRG